MSYKENVLDQMVTNQVITRVSYRVDDGHLIEPETFPPILPLVVLNGARGVATGWSTVAPAFPATIPWTLSTTYADLLTAIIIIIIIIASEHDAKPHVKERKELYSASPVGFMPEQCGEQCCQVRMRAFVWVVGGDNTDRICAGAISSRSR
jgi:hypothetical protein